MAPSCTPHAIGGGLGWVQYEAADFRLDLVEGEYRALSTAYQWVRGAPDLLFARAEEWHCDGSRLMGAGFIRLVGRPHHRDLMRASVQMLAATPQDLADLLAKMAMIEHRVSDTRLASGLERRSRGETRAPRRGPLLAFHGFGLNRNLAERARFGACCTENESAARLTRSLD